MQRNSKGGGACLNPSGQKAGLHNEFKISLGHKQKSKRRGITGLTANIHPQNCLNSLAILELLVLLVLRQGCIANCKEG